MEMRRYTHFTVEKPAVILMQDLSNDEWLSDISERDDDNESDHIESDFDDDLNSIRDAVDMVDQPCNSYCVQKKTKKWPVAVFMHNLNLAGINGFPASYNHFLNGILANLTRTDYFCVACQTTIKERFTNISSFQIHVQEVMRASNAFVTTPQQKTNNMQKIKLIKQHHRRSSFDRKTGQICSN